LQWQKQCTQVKNARVDFAEEPYDEKRPVVRFGESLDIASIGMTIGRNAKMSAETIRCRADEVLYLPKFAEAIHSNSPVILVGLCADRIPQQCLGKHALEGYAYLR